MKKKVLFVNPSLSTGGAEKSLFGLLKYWDYEKYDVDVYTFVEAGEYAKLVDERVNVIDENKLYCDFYSKSVFSSVKALLSKGHLFLSVLRLMWAAEPVIYRLLRKKYTRDSRFDWFVQKKMMLKTKKHYDIAIGYMEGGPNYYVSDCVDADVKVGWIHTDYSRTNPNVHLDTTRLSRMKSVVTVSENSKKEIIKLMPFLEEKICVIPNIIDTQKIDRMVGECVVEKECEFVICSVGRLVKLKGFDIAVDTAKILSDEGIDFKWYIVGDGEERQNLERQIKELGLEEKVILTGSTQNPYSYMNVADVCVQLSSYEGRGLVIEEAQYLKKIVVASRIGAFEELIIDGETGVISDREASAVAENVKKVIFDESFSLDIINHLKEKRICDKDIVCAVEKLWEN